MKSTVLLPFIAAVLLVMVSAVAVLAADQPSDTAMTPSMRQGPVVNPGSPASADVFIGESFAFRIPASAGGFSPMRRAEIVAYRLKQAFDAGMSWQDMRVMQMGKEWVVTADSMIIITADTASARAYRISAGMLANRWARQTVIAMGGQPQMIAQQLLPLRTRVAGVMEEMVAAWMISPTKSVQLLDAESGEVIGRVMVGGPSARLDATNSVLRYQYMIDGASVCSFIPIAGTSVSSQPNRIAHVGLVSIDAGMLRMTENKMGTSVQDITEMLPEDLNSRINSMLAENVRLQASTKVVPLCDMESNRIVGMAQVIGYSQDVMKTQTVLYTMIQENMLKFHATASSPPFAEMPQTFADVVVQSLIVFPKEDMTAAGEMMKQSEKESKEESEDQSCPMFNY